MPIVHHTGKFTVALTSQCGSAGTAPVAHATGKVKDTATAHNHRQKTDKSSFLCAGTVPVAHATGGLKDTVITYNEHQKDGTTGFAFEGVSADSLKAALWDCLQLYRSITFFWITLVVLGYSMLRPCETSVCLCCSIF